MLDPPEYLDMPIKTAARDRSCQEPIHYLFCLAHLALETLQRFGRLARLETTCYNRDNDSKHALSIPTLHISTTLHTTEPCSNAIHCILLLSLGPLLGR